MNKNIIFVYMVTLVQSIIWFSQPIAIKISSLSILFIIYFLFFIFFFFGKWEAVLWQKVPILVISTTVFCCILVIGHGWP